MKKNLFSIWINKGTILSTILILIFFSSSAQVNLDLLLDMAERNYPAIAARQAEARAAKNSVALEKNTLTPSLDAAYQANYATYNNITGMYYPGQLIPVSGPPTPGNFNDPVPGSAISLLLKWSPLTFGQRSASADYHQMMYEKQLAMVEDEILRVKFRVAYLYLDIATTTELIKAYNKNIERNEYNIEQVSSLVNAGLRPGVDSLKFKGELSKARTELFYLQNKLESQKYELMELLASDSLINIVPDKLFTGTLPDPYLHFAAADSVLNPAIKMAHSEWKAQQSRLKQINRSWTPRLEFWGTAYSRGSGVNYDGTISRQDGFSFSRHNYGAGLQLVFPIMEIPDVKLKSNRQAAIVLSSERYLQQTRRSINSKQRIAVNDLATSLKVAGEVPVEFRASESAYYALQARYNEGLTGYTDLIQAQYDLLIAESHLKNSFTAAWKSLLNLAVIQGDINIFISQIKSKE